MQVRRTL